MYRISIDKFGNKVEKSLSEIWEKKYCDIYKKRAINNY